jgi:hypothetical protein
LLSIEDEDIFEGEDGELLMKVKSEGEEYCCLFLEVMLFGIFALKMVDVVGSGLLHLFNFLIALNFLLNAMLNNLVAGVLASGGKT